MRGSAALLMFAGLALLFAADDILPRAIRGLPASGAWVGQLLGSAWLALAALTWLNRGARLGGIYGRPVVLANAIVYFVSAIVLLKNVTRQDAPAVVAVFAILFSVLAVAYGWLMFRGPFAGDDR
jgi:hypothetical protein